MAEPPAPATPGERLHHPQLKTLVDTARFHGTHSPQATAVVCEDRDLTYARLHSESNRIAHAIRAAGAAPGARVAYLGKESEHYYEILFGCAKSETVLVPINWRLAAPEVSHILQDSGSELLFLEDEFAPVLDRLATTPPKTVGRLGTEDGLAPGTAGHADS